MSVVLGVDPGSVRVGLAASDPGGTLASPVATVPRRDGDRLWTRLADEIERRGAGRIVVGLPRRLDGSEGPSAEAARSLAAEIGRRTGLPVELWDEWLTTVEAQRSLIASGGRRVRRRDTIDAVAASIMLQAWLDAGRGRPRRGAEARRRGG